MLTKKLIPKFNITVVKNLFFFFIRLYSSCVAWDGKLLIIGGRLNPKSAIEVGHGKSLEVKLPCLSVRRLVGWSVWWSDCLSSNFLKGREVSLPFS